MKTKASLPNRLHFEDVPLPAIQVKKEPRGRLIRVQTNGDEEYVTDPNGRYAYDLVDSFSYVYQWRIGADGVLHPLSLHKIYAHSHPTSLCFHPNGCFAYVTCSHGAICQYHARSGVLIPLNSPQVYADNNPSTLWFDRTGNFASVITPAVDGGYPFTDRVYIYAIERDGHLNLAHRLEVHGASRKISRGVLSGDTSSFTVSGDILGR